MKFQFIILPNLQITFTQTNLKIFSHKQHEWSQIATFFWFHKFLNLN